jgi:signal transduction histidine kinase
MTASHDPSADDLPRDLLPLRPTRSGPCLADLLTAIVSDVAADRRRRGLPPVRIELDAAAGQPPVGDDAFLRAGLLPLVAAACEAAADGSLASDAPRLREVVITAVETRHGLEIEVADSGPGPGSLPAAPLAAARGLSERFGGDVRVAACPEGGTAVTLRFPARRQQSMAA